MANMETEKSTNMRPVLHFERGEFGGIVVTNGRAIENCKNTILSCLDTVLKRHRGQPRSAIAIADIGTADGRSSLEIINSVINQSQSTLGTEQPIIVNYIDQVGNDFNRLFRVIQGNEDIGVSGLQLGPKVFYAVNGGTMYEQCLPNEFVDIALSFIAAMTMSKIPCKIKGGITYSEADEDEKAIVKEQSRKDWRQFLIMRGRELKPGTFDGHVVENIEGGYGQLSGILHSLVTDGIISQEEYVNTNQNVDNYRTKEEHMEPFIKGDPDIVDLGLELVSVRSFMLAAAHPFFEILEKDDATKKRYADAVVANIKPWFYHVIYNGLSATRSSEDRRHVVDVYFSKVWDFAVRNSDFKPKLPLIEVVIKKKI